MSSPKGHTGTVTLGFTTEGFVVRGLGPNKQRGAMLIYEKTSI
jgi:hypothetical protein